MGGGSGWLKVALSFQGLHGVSQWPGAETRDRLHIRASGWATWPRCQDLLFVQLHPVSSPCCEEGSGRKGGWARPVAFERQIWGGEISIGRGMWWSELEADCGGNRKEEREGTKSSKLSYIPKLLPARGPQLSIQM